MTLAGRTASPQPWIASHNHFSTHNCLSITYSLHSIQAEVNIYLHNASAFDGQRDVLTITKADSLNDLQTCLQKRRKSLTMLFTTVSKTVHPIFFNLPQSRWQMRYQGEQVANSAAEKRKPQFCHDCSGYFAKLNRRCLGGYCER